MNGKTTDLNQEHEEKTQGNDRPEPGTWRGDMAMTDLSQEHEETGQ